MFSFMAKDLESEEPLAELSPNHFKNMVLGKSPMNLFSFMSNENIVQED
jgi:hypothetical protein